MTLSLLSTLCFVVAANIFLSVCLSAFFFLFANCISAGTIHKTQTQITLQCSCFDKRVFFFWPSLCFIFQPTAKFIAFITYENYCPISKIHFTKRFKHITKYPFHVSNQRRWHFLFPTNMFLHFSPKQSRFSENIRWPTLTEHFQFG